MPENGGVGGTSSVGTSANGNDSPSTSSPNSTSTDSQTTAESIANSPTTADTLSGGEAASNSGNSSVQASTDTNSSAEVSNEANPDPGTGSLDAAVASSQNRGVPSVTDLAPELAPEEAVTPDTPAPVFDNESPRPDSTTRAKPRENPNGNLGVTTSESLTSAASITGTLVEGGINATKDHFARSGRALAAATLTNGNAGSLPAAGFANRADLAKALTDARITTATAMDVTPYGPNAVSSQQLSTAARNTRALGKAAGVAGTVVGPVVAAYEGYHSAPAESTTGERLANMIGGGLKEVDDSGVAAVAGGVTAAGTVFAGGLISAGGVTAPAGAAVIASAPATATAAAVGATKAYDGTSVDTAFDDFIDNSVEPVIADVIDGSIETYEAARSWVGGLVDRMKSWF